MKIVDSMRIILVIMLLPLLGCGVVTDMATDNEWRWGTFGNVDFISPVKLRVGVLPFRDEVGLGGPEVGATLANLLAEELSEDERLVVVPMPEVEQVMSEIGLSLLSDLSPQQIAELGLALRLNAVVEASVSELRQYSLRKGWRRMARLVTSQQEYINVVLAVKAVDAQTGIILSSRANIGEYVGASKEPDFFAEGSDSDQPAQEALEGSLDEALEEAHYRVLTGLSMLPFKATVIYTGDGVATISFGEGVGLKPGVEFVRLEAEETVTNTIGDTYQIPGAVVARLKINDVTQDSATLEIEEGVIYPGDTIMARNWDATSNKWWGW